MTCLPLPTQLSGVMRSAGDQVAKSQLLESRRGDRAQCHFKAGKTYIIQKKRCNTFKPRICMQEKVLLYFQPLAQLVNPGTMNLWLDK